MGKTIGVLGGGISGLTFASLVGRAEILEKGNVCGGLMRSFREDGFVFDRGSHALFSKNAQALGFMLGLLGRNIIRHRRDARIFYKGSMVKYPFENGLGDLPRWEALGCALDYVFAALRGRMPNALKPRNFAEWMRLRFGRAIAKKYLYPYNCKVWDYPPEKMGAFWAEGRVPQPPVHSVIRSAIGLPTEGYAHQLHFYYPLQGGIQAVTDALIGRVGARRICKNFEVRKIRKEGNRWVVHGQGKKKRIYDRLVSTIHIRDLIDRYEGASSEARAAARRLRHNSMWLVMIGLGREYEKSPHWAYIPAAGVLPNRISYPSKFSPSNAPKGQSSLLAEITFSPGSEKAKMKKAEVADRTIEDLHDIGVLDKRDVSFVKIARLKHAYVVYDSEYQENIEAVECFAREEGVRLLGRFSEFQYYNSDKCVERALSAAAAEGYWL